MNDIRTEEANKENQTGQIIQIDQECSLNWTSKPSIRHVVPQLDAWGLVSVSLENFPGD